MPETVNSRLVRVETKVDAIQQDVAEIRKALDGNHRPGLLERMTRMEAGNRKAAGVVGGIVSAIVSGAATVIARMV